MTLTGAAEAPESRIDAQVTLPKLLSARAAADGARIAMREKRRGIWLTSSWSAVSMQARELAIGLQALGVSRGDRMLVIGDNRPRLYIAMMAAQMIGGVILPVAAETPEEALVSLVRRHTAAFAICDDAIQCAKLLRVRARVDGLTTLLLDRTDSRQSGDDVVALDHLFEQAGRSRPSEQDRLARAMDEVEAADLATILVFPDVSLGSPPEVWAEPQAVMQTHADAIAQARTQIQRYALGPQDGMLAYLPLGSRLDHHFSCVLAPAAGFSLNFPESADTVPNDLREIGPTLHVLPDWALKQLMSGVLRRAKDANFVSRRLFSRYMRHGRASKAATPSALGRLLFHEPLRDVLGFGRTRLLFVDGRNADAEAAAFFTSLGINLVCLDDWVGRDRSDRIDATSPTLSPATGRNGPC